MINGIDYSNWENPKLKALAQQADTDGTKGLNKEEVIEFTKLAKENNIQESEIVELLGVNISQKVRSSKAQNSQFQNAVNYYNEKMDSSQRSDVSYSAYNILQTKLYEMEKAIDNAFLECETYQDIAIVPKRYYRFYPNFNDKLINFDIDSIRNLTAKDMAELHELKDKIEYIMESANGITEHSEPNKTEFDIEALAEKHLGMSYEEFATKYKEELEFCKTVTAADLNSMTETQRMVYAKVKAYATEMLTTTINEAHNTNWDAGERKQAETSKATDGMSVISNFETDGISASGLAKIESGITYKAFEEALVNKYQESEANGIDKIVTDKKDRSKKVLINGQVLIFTPDGSIYNTSGQKIK